MQVIFTEVTIRLLLTSCLCWAVRQLTDTCLCFVYLRKSRRQHSVNANEHPKCHFLPGLCQSLRLLVSNTKISVHGRIVSCSKDRMPAG